MIGISSAHRFSASVQLGLMAVLAVVAACVSLLPSVAAQDQRIIGPHQGHVLELSHYLDQVEIYAPIRHEHLAVFPIRLRDDQRLPGTWLTMDQALARGVLLVRESASARVPVVDVENRSRDHMIFIMSGEILAGGKQTRAVRQDIVLSPGERVELRVFCVEQRRWAGGPSFKASGALLPQSIQQSLRKGVDQRAIWAEVARNNRALGAENKSGSLELALNSADVKGRLAVVRGTVLPAVPHDTVGYLFVAGHRALGAEFFGRSDIAKALLPKLLDSYAVDSVLQRRRKLDWHAKMQESVAVAFFGRIRKAGSRRVAALGSGSGIRTQSPDLLGDGVGLSGVLVHFGVQSRERIVPLPVPRPMVPNQPGR